MQDLYQVLGISSDATARVIKRAYRERALSEHPDKGGDAERMALLTTAYDTLMDPVERRKYDQEWEIFNASEDTQVTLSGYLPVAGVAFSQAFRQIRERFFMEFQKKPLEEMKSPILKPFRCELYPKADHLFAFVKAKRDKDEKVDIAPLTPEKGVGYFVDFLRGEYSRSHLREISRAFYRKIKDIESFPGQQADFKLYCGIYEIFLVAVKEKTPNEALLLSLLKITDYAKQMEQSMSFMVSLLQSKYFRCLFSQALHYYWLSEENALEESYIKSFNGVEATESLIEKFKSQLSESRSTRKSNDSAARSLRRVRLLLKLEHTLQGKANRTDRAHFYREKAFLLLDWVPCLKGIADTSIVVNTLLQIGLSFLRAAAQEEEEVRRMADEKLAAQIYAVAVGIAHDDTPDIALYALMHSVKCLSSCRYVDEGLKEMVEAFQHRALWIADLFPFFQPPLASADFIGKEDTLDVMRRLLHALVDRAEDGKVEIHQSRLRVFYQAHEASLKNWYDEKHDAEREQRFRQRLMEELLKDKKWSTKDVDYNLNAPWPVSHLDEGGWSCHKSSILTPAVKKNVPTCKSVHGAQINYKTGRIDIAFDYCKQDDKDYNRLLTPFDLMELIQRGLISAAFSLDPVDPDMPYHPFNEMWFRPSILYHSQLLHTMFITDYLLKFLTSGQEVQRRHPYELRSLEQVMSALPDHLKEVIREFHSSNRKESLNRFWIESEAVELAVDGEDDTVTLALGPMRMVVKHRKMERDAEGNLVDKEGEGEGWDCYVLSRQQKRELYEGERVIAEPALILDRDSREMVFWEYQKPSHPFTLNTWSVAGLRLLQRNSQEKVLTEDYDSLRQVHNIVVEACRKMGVPHRYSPEFIFAQQFTKHYDEFAVYFPEFGRLRELSKAAALVKVLVAQRAANREEIDAIKKRLGYYKTTCAVQPKTWFTDIVNEPSRIKEHSYWYGVRSELNELISEGVFEQFREWRGKFSKEKLEGKRKEQLKDIMRQIGTLQFTRHSPEIKEVCDDNYQRFKNEFIDEHGRSAWRSISHKVYSEAIEPHIPTIIRKLTDQKKAACLEQLTKLFEDELNNVSRSESRGSIQSFLDGRNQSLMDHLVLYDRKEVAKEIKDVFPEHSINIIDQAVNNRASAIVGVVKCEVEKALKKKEEHLREALSGREKLEQTFADLGFELFTDKLDLEGTCLWVPASFRHDVEGNHSRTVYGGVAIYGKIKECINVNYKNAYLRQTKEDTKRLQLYRMVGTAVETFYMQYVVSPQYPSSDFELESQFYFRVEDGGRKIDIVVKCRKSGDVVRAIEIKCNTSEYTKKQQNKDKQGYESKIIKSPVELVRIKISMDWFEDLE